MYPTPSQTSNDFNSFTTNLEKLLVKISSSKSSNPHFLFMIAGFNAKLSNWSSNDTATTKGGQLDYSTTLYGIKQVISEPTHILEKSSSCIDFILSNKSNLIIESGVHPTLHLKCPYQIIYSKRNLKIEYPLPYTRKICYYNRSMAGLINRSIESFDWSKLFSGKNVHEQVELFMKTLVNILHNFFPNKILVCDDREPAYINYEIKK